MTVFIIFYCTDLCFYNFCIALSWLVSLIELVFGINSGIPRLFWDLHYNESSKHEESLLTDSWISSSEDK